MLKNKIFVTSSIILLAAFITVKIVTMPPLLKNARLIEIPEGSNAREIAVILEGKKVIRKASWFLFWAKRYNVHKRLEAGIYEFSGRTPLKKVISKLSRGEVTLVKVSIPEGYTVREIGAVLERKKLAESEEFIKYAEGKKLEGFLFPDTYLFPHKVSVEAISSTMFKRFKDIFEDLYGKTVDDTNFEEVKRIMTVASIVEEEAMYSDEREVIAGIIYRRISRNMPIQSCSTVLYALGKSKARLSSRDLRINSPYNTYSHRGLPPGPISNPGKDSISAAINPRKTSYLFFVSMGNGRNYFSRTYREHQAAINMYLSSGTQSETTAQEESMP